MINFLELPYEVEGDENRLMCYIPDNKLEALALPPDIKDIFCSVGISFRGSDVWYAKRFTLTPRDREDLVCRKFYSLFLNNWKWEWGIPYLKFSGFTRLFDDFFINRAVFIFLTYPEVSLKEQLVEWNNKLRFITKFSLVADLRVTGIPHFGVFTTDHKVAFSYFDSIKTGSEKRSNFERYNLDKILKDWEPDPIIREGLKAAASAAITELLCVKNLNLYVPGFLFFTSINVRRYRKAQEILTNKYQPRFIMNLPFTWQQKQYTVAFPICNKI